MQLRVQAQISV